MPDLKLQETQQELFPLSSGGSGSASDKSGVVRSFDHKSQKPILLTTTIEQIIFISIVLILFICFVFFLGILRGSYVSAANQQSTAPIRNSAPAPAAIAVSAQAAAVAPAVKVLDSTVVSKATKKAPATPQATKSDGFMKKFSLTAQAAKDNSKPYTIQLATYKKRDLASQEVEDLKKTGHYAMVVPSGSYFLVCVGRYASIDEAKKDLKLFGKKYTDRYLRRL